MAGTALAAEGSPVPPLQPGGIPRIGSPTEVRPLPDGPLHFVGIGGAGQSAIAYVLAQRGHVVRGSDSGISTTAKARLESVGCEVYTQHAAKNVKPDTAAVIATDAVNEQNPEIAEALKRGLPVFRRPEALASLVNSAQTSICVAGTHGKTTTTGMIASILIHAGLNPTVLIGGDLPLINGNSQNGDPDLVVAEACEAYGGLDCLSPTIAVITNCEPDHLDFHGTEENFYAAFIKFLNQKKINSLIMHLNAFEILSGYGMSKFMTEMIRKQTIESIIFNSYPIKVIEIEKHLIFLPTKENVATFGYVSIYKSMRPYTYKNTLRYKNIRRNKNGISFHVEYTGTIKLRVFGLHNIENACAAIGVASCFDIKRKAILSGLESFAGTGRRFERLGEVEGIAIVDDYAHHPTEIRATLQAARQAFPGRRIVAIYQPHLPSRTRDFLDAFAEALSSADACYLTDIYLAREPEQPGLIEALAERIRGEEAISPGSFLAVPSSPSAPSSREEGQRSEGRTERGDDASLPMSLRTNRGREVPEPCEGGEMAITLVKDRHDLPPILLRELKPGDVALFMGAGNIREQAEEFLKQHGR
ncbi:UDP-N-acetylmuramate--L-alanine ligase [Armatimonas sp.]|uniref:UDP-N-acetylmuramate--L-alanine ligase n=1 Tax=Armatimonas sp. TaxID=1872638 RepID=UPI0037511CE2